MDKLTPITCTVDGVHRITFQEQIVDSVSFIQNLLQVLCAENAPVLHQPVLLFATPAEKKTLSSGKNPSKKVKTKIVKKQYLQ